MTAECSKWAADQVTAYQLRIHTQHANLQGSGKYGKSIAKDVLLLAVWYILREIDR